MKIFVAGATGVLGHRAVGQLLATGAEVTGIARTRAKASGLEALGATPIEVSLFDREALTAAVAGHQVVCNLASSVPTGERAGAPDAWSDSHRIRTEGARNLVDAALRAGAERYVQESIALLYADGGDELLDEAAPVDPTAITQPALTAEAEAARVTREGGVGVALRFGTFYGFDSAHTIETVEAARRHGLFMVPGPPGAYWPSLTTDDAASSVVAALRAPAGVYNVAEDRPLTRAEHAEALAAALGTGALRPAMDGDLPPELSMMGRSLRVTSQLFKALTGWQPFASAWEGWPFVAAGFRTLPGADA